MNVTEWAKKEECWTSLQLRDDDVQSLLQNFLQAGTAVGKVLELADEKVGTSRWVEIKDRARVRGWLSPKSESALNKLISGESALNGPESNALTYLMERLDEVL